MALILKHQSRPEFLARLRADVRDSVGPRTVHLADRIVAMISDGDLTDAELRTQFGLTVAQWASLKGRWTSLINARRTLAAAQGE